MHVDSSDACIYHTSVGKSCMTSGMLLESWSTCATLYVEMKRAAVFWRIGFKISMWLNARSSLARELKHYNCQFLFFVISHYCQSVLYKVGEIRNTEEGKGISQVDLKWKTCSQASLDTCTVPMFHPPCCLFVLLWVSLLHSTMKKPRKQLGEHNMKINPIFK